MSPDLGRFLQPDPIGFKGDSSNLYRYCGNDWANRSDPMGTDGDQIRRPGDATTPYVWTPQGDASQKIEQIELRMTAYAPTANAVEQQTQRQAAREAKQAGEGLSMGQIPRPEGKSVAHVVMDGPHFEYTKDPIYVAGNLSDSKTKAVLQPPTATTRPDDKISVTQRAVVTTTFHPNPSPATFQREMKRVEAIREEVRYLDSVAMHLADKGFGDGASGIRAVEHATRNDWNRSMLRNNMLFDGFNQQ